MPPCPARPPFLSLTEATFRLGDRLVFENTTWRFGAAEQWAIVGANGSGKTIFAAALRGQLPLVGGAMRYHFRPPAGLSATEVIGHVSFDARKLDVQETVVQSRWNSIEEDGALRVREFLSYDRVMEVNPYEVTDRHALARPGFEKRQRRAVAQLRLAPLLDQVLLSLSNGERQRAQLARALSHPLRLLILDEPYVGLDAATREHLHHLLEQLMSTPIRVLIATTRLEDLPRHITHLIWLENNQVVDMGPKSQVRKNPLQGPRRKTHFRTGAKNFNHSAQPETKRPAPGRVLVRLKNVTVRYGSRTILEGLDWCVCAGESWALLGPNGAGKTTLLSLILGDNPQAYNNQVEVFGRQRGDGESIWELKRRLGWISPELQLHFAQESTCFEVVASGFYETMGLFEPPTARQRAAAHQWLRRFDLAQWASEPLAGLSAGQQRMVLLARALVKRPWLLILDEPCQGLDGAHRQLFLGTLEALLREGAVTAIYVTHRPEEIPATIQRVLRLRVT